MIIIFSLEEKSNKDFKGNLVSGDDVSFFENRKI